MNRLHKEYNKKLQKYIYKEIKDVVKHDKDCNNRLTIDYEWGIYLIMLLIGLIPIIVSYINMHNYYK